MSNSPKSLGRRILVFVVIIVYALLLMVFGEAFFQFGSMTFSVLAVAPLAIGFITVGLYMRYARVNWTNAFFLPWASCFALLIVTIALKFEGGICWAMIFPAWASFAGLGGFMAKQLLKQKDHKEDNPNILDDLDSRNLKISMVSILPFIIGFFEDDMFMVEKQMQAEYSIEIAASPEQVWSQILKADTLFASEKSVGLANVFGFPAHQFTTLDAEELGGQRIAYYENGLFFNEEIIDIKESRFLRLKIDVNPDDVPPNVMDEHIVIGGEYFDLDEDRYELEPLSNGHTLVTLTSDYRIKTPLNFYTEWWAKWLMDGIIKGELTSLKDRAERQ